MATTPIVVSGFGSLNRVSNGVSPLLMTLAPGRVNPERMRICFIGKYPPIQGGVSAQTYWAVRGLAERGHEVCVVTNADEVEDRNVTVGGWPGSCRIP
jgi:hypothetical protein